MDILNLLFCKIIVKSIYNFQKWETFKNGLNVKRSCSIEGVSFLNSVKIFYTNLFQLMN